MLQLNNLHHTVESIIFVGMLFHGFREENPPTFSLE